MPPSRLWLAVGLLLNAIDITRARRSTSGGQAPQRAGGVLLNTLPEQRHERHKPGASGLLELSTRPSPSKETIAQRLGVVDGTTCGGIPVGLAGAITGKVAESEDSRLGCNLGCGCPLIQRCYHHHIHLDGLDSVDVGICSLSVPSLVAGSLVLFFGLLAFVVCSRAVLIHCALGSEGACSPSQQGSVYRLGSSSPRRSFVVGKDSPRKSLGQESPRKSSGPESPRRTSFSESLAAAQAAIEASSKARAASYAGQARERAEGEASPRGGSDARLSEEDSAEAASAAPPSSSPRKIAFPAPDQEESEAKVTAAGEAQP